MNKMEKFGGSMWDTLFLLINDKDNSNFIFDFVNRLPCEKCIKNFHKCIKRNNISFNGDKNDTYKKLWLLRSEMNTSKYKNTEEELNNYLNYLFI